MLLLADTWQIQSSEITASLFDWNTDTT